MWNTQVLLSNKSGKIQFIFLIYCLNYFKKKKEVFAQSDD